MKPMFGNIKTLVVTCVTALYVMIFSNLHAASLSGGDAATAADANVVVDIVFAIDTSGSMSDEARAISDSINTALTNMQCDDVDVWVNARLVGLRGTWSGTLFDETAKSVLVSVGATTTINHNEDNGPVVFDFATANSLYYVDTTTASQGYAKAIVTIGDEGLENGEPVNSADYAVGKAANDIAITNGVRVFSLLGHPDYGALEVLRALAEGGVTLGGYEFNDTGGLFATTSSTTPYEEVLEQVFCEAARPRLKGVKVTSVLSTNDIDLDNTSFVQTPDSIRTVGDETHIEWQFEEILINQIENLDYDVVLRNPVPGEIRTVTHRLELSYLDINGNLVDQVLGEQVVKVLPSVFDIAVNTDKSLYIAHEDVLIDVKVSNLSEFEAATDLQVVIYDSEGNIVEQVTQVNDISIEANADHDISSLIFNTANLLQGNYSVKAQLLDDNGEITIEDLAEFEVRHSINAGEPLASLRVTVDQSIYNTSGQVEIGTLSRNITDNVMIESAMVKLTILAPDGTIYAELEQTIGDLAAGNQRQRNLLQTLNAAPQGTYTIQGELLDNNQTLLATDEVQYEVLENLQITLTGQVSVAAASILPGEAQTCSNTITNGGTTTLENTVFRQVLLNIDTEAQTLFDEQTATSLAAGVNHQFTTTIDTTALENGQYSCILQRKDGENWHTMAYAYFAVGASCPVDPDAGAETVLEYYPAQNLLINGSFEQHGHLRYGNWGVFRYIPGWQASPLLEIQKNARAYHGSKQLELDVYRNGKIWQTVNTQQGASYTLSLQYKPRVEQSGTNTNDVQIWWNNQLLATLSGDQSNWTFHEFPVTADGKTSTVKLVAAGDNDSYGGLIDDVQLTCLSCIQENLLQNPSFEQHGDFNQNLWGWFTEIPGWSIEDGEQSFEIIAGARGPVATLGQAVLGLSTQGTDHPATITQTMPVQPGTALKLTLDYASAKLHNDGGYYCRKHRRHHNYKHNHDGWGYQWNGKGYGHQHHGSYQQMGEVDVLWNDETITTLKTPYSAWTHYQLDIPASDATTGQLSFRSGQHNTQYLGGYLDNISLSCTNHYPQNLIENGSFEQHGHMQGWYKGWFNNIPGWQATPRLEIHRGHSGGIGAADGRDKLKLDVWNNVAGKKGWVNSEVEQVITTEMGKTYQLSLHYASGKSHGHHYWRSSNTYDIEVWWNNEKIDTLSGKQTDWQAYTYTVTADTAESTLKFVASGYKDGRGGYIDKVSLTPQISKPAISSQPELTIEAGQYYSYQLMVTGMDTTQARYILEQGPESMTLSSTGLLEWNPIATGEYPVRIRVVDTCGKTVVQTFTITVDLPEQCQ